MLPIGLDWSTPYTFQQSITLNAGQVGPGNWGSLALGGTGGSNECTNLADGYQGPLAINQWVDTEPGFKKGPVDQGFSDRISAGQSEFLNDTYQDYNPADPRAVILPMVVWNSPNGRSQVEDYGLRRCLDRLNQRWHDCRPISSTRKLLTAPATRTRHFAAPAEDRSWSSSSLFFE